MNLGPHEFCSTQAGYGIMISRNADLPSLNAPDEEWNKILERVAHLAALMADKQLAESKKRKERSC